MHTLLRRAKEAIPLVARSRLRRALGRVPLAGSLARLSLSPWQVGFVVGGTMKGGTTALHSFLSRHPEIGMARDKEAHFFDSDEHFPPGQLPDYGRYHACFAPDRDTRIVGDATPVYMYWGPAPARAAAYNPRMKWIVLLRQPAERAYSHWNMLRQGGEETLPFEEALARERSRWTDARARRLFSYVDRGFYARQLARIFAVVPRRQVLVLRSEELRRDHHATLRRVFEFLGVDAGVRVEPAEVHARCYELPMADSLRRTLTARFADDIRELERLLDWDLSDWQDS